MKRTLVGTLSATLIGLLLSSGLALAQGTAAQTATPKPAAPPPAAAKAPAAAAAPAAATAPAAPAAPAAPRAPTADKLDINTASVEQLEALKGVGPVRAKAIVKGRPYKGKDDLVRRKIVPQSVYDGISEQIIAKQK